MNEQDAIRYLKDNGYIVIRETEKMQKDADRCEANDYSGDCGGCSCNVCLMTGD